MKRTALYTLTLLAASLMLQPMTARADEHREGRERIVDGPRVEATGHDWAMIAWTTNTGGSSVVRYGRERDRMDERAEAPYADRDHLKSGHEVHRVKVTHLRPNTTYYFAVDSAQGEGTGTRASSRVGEFRTK